MRKSFRSYDDVREILEAARLHGGVLQCSSPGAAVRTRQRMNQLRILERDSSLEIYPDGHPMKGKSPYDHLTIRLAPGSDTLYLDIERNTFVKFTPNQPTTEAPTGDAGQSPTTDK